MRANKMALVGTILAMILAVAVVAVAVTAVHPRTAARTPSRFTVRGHVVGLYPGARTTVKVWISNPFPFAIRLRSVRATVSSPTVACPSNNLRVVPWRGTLRIAAHHRKRLRLRARVAPDAATGCQGVRFRLAYHGKAVRA